MLMYFTRIFKQKEALSFAYSGAVIQQPCNLIRVRALRSAKCRLPWCWLKHLGTYVIQQHKKQFSALCDL